MTSVSLKINITKLGSVKTMKFNGDQTISEICKEIREKLGEGNQGASDHGLFWPDHGKWLDPGRTLDFYDLKTGDLVEYKKKHRPLRVKMLDDTVKTILVDDSSTVQQLVATVCGRIGITNPDEYSFTTEKLEIESQQKQEVLRKSKSKDVLQLTDKTQDTVWLNPEKTLREQGVDENEMLLLKKKFFFSDQNIDRNDPVQLNLLYVQAQDAIVKGTHPCTLEEAAQFAALQCQIQFGNHEPDKHKPGFLRMQEFIAPEYAKRKTEEVEKKIFQEHRKLQGMSELNAKFRYVQLCRSLKTYGVTFFLVKEKVPKKNKTIPVLLGITRDSVMRLDADTKEVLKVWSLTTLRRWAASPNSFTLDFGDYSEAYYSVQTTEGEAISQLIAGYIDIILKKKQQMERAQQDDETEMSITEENMAPGQGSAISMIPGKAGQSVEVNVASHGLMNNADGSAAGAGKLGMHGMQYYDANGNPLQGMMRGNADMGFADMSGASGAQQAVLQNINNGFAAVNAAQSDLNVATTLPPMGNDPASVQWRKQTMDLTKQNVTSQVAAHLAATAAVLTHTAADPNEMDYNAIGADISTISSNLGQLSSGTKMVAALMEDQGQGEKVLDAAKKLAGDTSKLLTATQPAIMGQGNRADLLSAAQGIGASSSELLRSMGDPDVSLAAQQELVDLAKQVAAAMTEAVQCAKVVASKCPEPKNQQEVISSTQKAAAGTTQLVTTTQVVAPTINNPLCQEQLIESTKLVDKAVTNLQGKAKQGCSDKQANADLGAAADKVRAALQRLIDKARAGGANDSDLTDIDRQAEIVMSATAALVESIGDAAGVVQNAKGLAIAATQLVNALKAQAANEMDPNEKARLLAAARALADATTKMVNAAKDAARNPSDPAVQARLRAAAEALQAATKAALGAESRRKAFKKLQLAAKSHAAAATQLISASKASAPSNRNQASQMQLTQACKGAAESTAMLVGAVRAHADKPDDSLAQLKLINAAKNVLNPGQTLVSAAKAATPTVGDQAAQGQLQNFTRATHDALKKLKEAVDAAEEVSGSLELESANQTIEQAKKEVTSAQDQVAKGTLKPSVDQTPEGCLMDVGATSKNIGASMAQLISAASQGNENYTGVAARDTAASLATLAHACVGVAATSNDPAIRNDVLAAAKDVLSKSQDLISSAKNCLDKPNDAAAQQQMAQVAQSVNQSMGKLLDSLPGQRDVANAMLKMKADAARMNGPYSAETGETFQSAQNKLATAAAKFAVDSNNFVSASRGTPNQLKAAAEQLEKSFDQLVTAGQAMASQTNDPSLKHDISAYVNDVFNNTAKLMQAAKAYNADPNGTNLKNLLALAAKNVADSIQNLLSLCSTAAPGQKEAQAAIRQLELSAGKLDTVNEPKDNEDSYFASLKKVIEGQSELAGVVSDIPNAAKGNNSDQIVQDITKVADTVSGMTDSTARAAFLIGASDPNSVPAVPGLVDQTKFSQAMHDIEAACERLQDKDNNQQQVLAAASVIAKNTSALCNACKVASTKTANPVARNQFIASAKTVAATTSALVADIKNLATNPTPEARQKCAASSQPLIDAVRNLTTFAASPEFAPTQAFISPVAQQNQAPLMNSNRQLVDSSKELIAAAQKLAANPQDAAALTLFQAQSKSMTDQARNLVNAIKANAPGQKECDQAIEKVNNAVADVDQAAVQAAVGNLQPVAGLDQHGFRENLLNSARALLSSVDVVCDSAKTNPENLAVAVSQLTDSFIPMANAAVGAASKIENQTTACALLDQAKHVGESTVDMLYAAKQAGGNPEAKTAQDKVDETKTKVQDSLKNLINALEGSSDVAGMNQAIDDLTIAMAELDVAEDVAEDESYQAYADEVMMTSQDLANTMAQVLRARNADDYNGLAGQVGSKYKRLVQSARGAAAAADDEKTREAVLESVRTLGGANLRLVDSMKAAAGNPKDTSLRPRVGAGARDVSTSVASVVKAVKDGSKGLQQCQEAINAIEDIISELDTSIVFANAGQLDPIDTADNFNNYREPILNGTRSLTQDVKSLVSGATGTQEMLAQAAGSSVVTITNLKDSLRNAAASITSADRKGQEQLLESCKLVAEKLQNHIRASMKAAGRGADSVELLKTSAKDMVTAISELLKVVKAVGDENSRGIRAIEGAIAGISGGIIELESDSPAQGSAVPDEVVQSAKEVAAAAASLVTSSNQNQEAIIASAGNARTTVENMLRVGKAATAEAPKDKKDAVHGSAKGTAEDMVALLKSLHALQTANTPANKTAVQNAAKQVATRVNTVVSAAGSLVPTGYVDPNDPNVIAERELLAAANSIEAAARKLASLQPAERPRDANEDLGFEEQIFEAAKAIAAATAALVRAATVTQREIVAKGKVGNPEQKKYFSDGTWSDGLVSAAKIVANTTGSLCEAANDAVQGRADREKVIAAARGVSMSTAQLVTSATVKTDANSESQARLRAAGKTVTKATETLVKAAENSVAFDDTEAQVAASMKGGAVGAYRAEMQAMEELLRKEREMEEARRKLGMIRKQKYENAQK